MAEPVYESNASATDSAGGTDVSVTCNKPTGVAENDLMIACVSINPNGTVTMATPSGWTAIDTDVGETTAIICSWFRKVATGSEPSTYDFDSTGDSDTMIVDISRYSGVDTTSPINAFNSSYQGNDLTPDALSVTTTVDECLILRNLGRWREQSGDISPDAGTEIWEINSGGGTFDKHMQSGVTQSQASAGATGELQWTGTNARNSSTITIAIAPAAGGGGTSNPWNHYAQQA